MNGTDLLAGPLGPALAIAGMTVVTYGCRIGGAVIMSHVRITPRVERALAALPGSIVASTVVPIAIKSGPAAVLGVACSALVARFLGSEIAAIAAGLLVAALGRAAGL